MERAGQDRRERLRPVGIDRENAYTHRPDGPVRLPVFSLEKPPFLIL
jgi:hypothetical protein